MLTCEEATRVCSDELERPLSLREQAAVRLHLMMCSGCANYRRQLRTLSEVMQAYAEGRAPTEESRPGADP